MANGWANGKFLFVDEKNIVGGYNYLKKQKKDIRDFIFWDIADEGKIPQSNSTEDKSPFYMVKYLIKYYKYYYNNSLFE